MSMKTNSSKLAHLLRLCFAAGIVSLSGAAVADCNSEHSVCPQQGAEHIIPSACAQYPDNPICHGENDGDGHGNSDRPIDLDVALASGVSVLHAASNSIKAGCSSPYAVRQASAKADISAWWPTYGKAWDYGVVGVTVTYSTGQREIWNVYYGGRTNSGDVYRDPSLTFESVGNNAVRGVGYMGLALQHDVYPDGVWGVIWGKDYLLCK